jgi:phospholipid/cholesterol/gamma-HCH transport system ATP-binding protein
MDDMEQANGNKEAPIAVEELCKNFGTQTVLNGMNLSVAAGETVAVLGRSGTGKSVLLRLLIGLETPDSGSVRVCGQDLTKLDAAQLNELRKRIGFLFQQAALYDSMTVEENVAFPLRRHCQMSDDERNKRVRELLQSVGITQQDLDKMPSQISGGMQKRVGLARALALEPDILLFDEPTSGLDPITSEEIGKLILELKQTRRMAAVVVTHDLRSTKIFADRLVLMDKGNIQAEGTLDDLQESRDEFVQQFLGENC